MVVMSSGERLEALLTELACLRVNVLPIQDFRTAREWLHGHPRVEVVFTDLSLSDGNWCDILKYVLQQGIDASVVVTSRHGDARLWSEVLWLGAYDLLVEPYESFEIGRIVQGAVRAARNSALPPQPCSGWREKLESAVS